MIHCGDWKTWSRFPNEEREQTICAGGVCAECNRGAFFRHSVTDNMLIVSVLSSSSLDIRKGLAVFNEFQKSENMMQGLRHKKTLIERTNPFRRYYRHHRGCTEQGFGGLGST